MLSQKACIVVKGSCQEEGIDYEWTLAPVDRLDSDAHLSCTCNTQEF